MILCLSQHLTPLQAHNSHFSRLQEDAAASLGTDHLIYRGAAHYLKVWDEQMVTMLNVTPGDWKKMKGEGFEECERALLKWVGIDLTAKVI